MKGARIQKKVLNYQSPHGNYKSGKMTHKRQGAYGNKLGGKSTGNTRDRREAWLTDNPHMTSIVFWNATTPCSLVEVQ
jgi:hypothetical protein